MPCSMIDRYAQILWSYLFLTHPLECADILLVLGGHDLRVPAYAAEVFQRGLASKVAISGGIAHAGDLLETKWEQTEARMFADVMIENGVPNESIILEEEAQNTGDNFAKTGILLRALGSFPSSTIVVTKPYMTRRAYATGKVHWPDVELIMTSFEMSFEEYCTGNIDRETVLNIMVGDLQRIMEYPKRGFQIEQEIPQDVLKAYHGLIEAGYDKHLLAS